jgi:hypothetical protein
MNYSKAVVHTNKIFMSYQDNAENVYYAFPEGCKWDSGNRASSEVVVTWGNHALVATGIRFIPLALAKQKLSKEDYTAVVRNWLRNGGTTDELRRIQKDIDLWK